MTTTRWIAALAAASLVFAACGDDDDAADTTTPDTSATTSATTNDTAATTEPPAATEATTAPSEPTAEPSTTIAEQALFPVTVTADNGDVTIDEQPMAIVSLSPSLTEIVYAIGAGDQVIAVDGSSDFPEGTPMTDLSGFRPNVEAIAELQPDLVLLARDRDDIVATLDGLGIQVVLLTSADDLSDVERQIRVLGDVTGHPDEADVVATETSESVDDLLASLPEQDAPLRAYYELSPDYSTVTSDTFVGAVLAAAGIENIADGVDPEAGPFPQLSAEYVLEQDPDLIFIAHTDGTVPTIEELTARPGWDQLTAVANDDIVFLDVDIVSRWGPRVVELVDGVVGAVQRAGPG
ncbi:MAG: helical backbone metal receptor [Actinomycetota bacterium]